ncbi:kinase-like domain-containing protein [Melanogaster broomeanus]|nr:kinase-like domain-containing protein [Melanogaster broomeanus]
MLAADSSPLAVTPSIDRPSGLCEIRVQSRRDRRRDHHQRRGRSVSSHYSADTFSTGRSHVVTLLDDFQLTSAHGSHICLVYEAAGSFSTIFKGNNKQLPVNQVKILARQLLLALDFLHRECHIVHTDIKPDNILIKLNDADKVLVQEIEDSLPMESPSKGDAPLAVLSRPISPFNLAENSDTAEILELNIELTDFGTAADVTGPHADIIQSYALRAPEVILGCGWNTSADIWDLGSLVNPYFPTKTGANEFNLLQIFEFLTGDEFNMSFTQKGERFDQYFKDDGRLRIGGAGLDLDTILHSYNVLDEVEHPIFVSFLRSMLRLNPSDRATAAELLRHEWLTK